MKAVRTFKCTLNIHQRTTFFVDWMLRDSKKSASKAVRTARWEIQNFCGNSFRVTIHETPHERI